MIRKTTRAIQSPSQLIAIPAQLHPRLASAGRRAPLTTVIALGALALGPSAVAAGAVSPLPASDYIVHSVCTAPTPGHAGCLALELVPATTAARAHTHPLGMTRSAPIRAGSAAEGADGLRPEDLRSAYFPDEQPDAPNSEPQTVALVDAYNDPKAEADLTVYDEEFKLPECNEANKCFEQVNQKGETGNPPSVKGKKQEQEAGEWALETATDIEVAHAICQNCHIVLVEADSASFEDLEAAEEIAAQSKLTGGIGATEISNSWGGEEPPTDNEEPPTNSKAFKHPGIVITAAAGDDGYLNWTEARAAALNPEAYYAGADYPAASSHVVAVGGTKLTLSGGVRQSETVWNEDPDPEGGDQGAGGGGCSAQFTAPKWQREVPDWTSVGCGVGGKSKRAIADIAADADPYTGVAIYDSVPYPYEEEGQSDITVLGWVPIGGTSVASPIIASMFALAGGAHSVEYPAATLYSHLGSVLLHDVVAGGNGECDGIYKGNCSGSLSSPFDCGQGALICNAAPGYDGPTGVGTPDGIGAFAPSGNPDSKQAEEKRAAEKQAEEKAAAARKAEEASAIEATQAEAQRAAEQAEAEQRSHSAAGTGTGTGTGQNDKVAGEGRPTAGADNALTGGTTGAGSLVSSPSPTTSTAAHGTTVRLSNLTLTLRAIAALDRSRPAISHVAFAFTLSTPATVRFTLARLLDVHGHRRWTLEPGSFTYAVPSGRNHLHLRGHLGLTPGHYRLTLAPAHGSARSLAFVLG